MNAIEKAQQTVDELRAKRADNGVRLRDIDALITEVSFNAHVGGDAKARKALADAESEHARIAIEEKSLAAAILVAEGKVKEAERAAADDDEKSRAKQAVDLIDQFEKRGEALDAKLKEFVAEYEALTADFKQLERLGFAPASSPLVATNMRSALVTALQFTPLRVEFLAPHERRDFIGVISGWASNVRARANAKLKPKSAKAA